MTKGNLPPQAYTREMLTQAFQWVQTQPEGIRKLAGSADALVGLYLRAKRSGDASLEAAAPVSTESFRASLKNLATELQQFSGPSQVAANNLNFVETSGDKVVFSDVQATQNVQQNGIPNSPPNVPKTVRLQEETLSPTKAVSPSQTSIAQSTDLSGIDSKTQSMIQMVQSRFNLSSEGEALRLLVSVGFEKLEKL